MRHTHEALSRGLGSGSIGYTERHQLWSKDSQGSPKSKVIKQPTSLEDARRQSEASAKPEAEMGQRKAAGLAIATANRNQLPTNSKRGSEPLSERRWTPGGIPRPAGLGEVGRPHLEASRSGSWCGSYAQPSYLLSTDATCNTGRELTLEGYK